MGLTKMVPCLREALVLLLCTGPALCSFISPSLGGAAESGLSLSDVVQRKSGSEYVALGNGNIGQSGSEGYDKGEAGVQGLKADSGHYSSQDGSRRDYDVGKQSQGQAQAFDQGNNAFQQHGSGLQKKGYHKSGFTNKYHKDESANKESFYEDSDDERGHRGHDNRAGAFGHSLQDAFRDGRHDGAFSGRNNAQQGLYDNGAGYNNRRGHSGSFENNRFHDDRRNFLQDGAGRIYDRHGNELNYRREQPYYHPGVYGSVPLVSGPLYSRDYLDAPPRYVADHRDYRRGELYYPGKAGFGGFRNGYSNGYSGYRKGYTPIEAHVGFRQPY